MRPPPPARVLLAALTVAMAAAAALCGGEGDALPDYQIAGGVDGTLVAVGSDTMLDLMTYWSEGFRAQYPAVRITLEEKGSNTAPPALISGRSQLAPMSRPMKSDEISAFTTRFGYPPTELVVAIDGLAIFVHRDNPLTGLTMRHLATVFTASATQPRRTGRCGRSWASPTGPTPRSRSTAAIRSPAPTPSSASTSWAAATSPPPCTSCPAPRR